MVDIYEHMALDSIMLDVACILEYLEDMKDELNDTGDIDNSLKRIEGACKNIDIIIHKILNGQLERLL